MSGSDDKNKRGFAGLSGLVSDSDDIGKPDKQQPKPESESSVRNGQPSPVRDSSTSGAGQPSKSTSTLDIKDNSDHLIGWIILFTVAPILILLFFGLSGQNGEKPSQITNYSQEDIVPDQRPNLPQKRIEHEAEQPEVTDNILALSKYCRSWLVPNFWQEANTDEMKQCLENGLIDVNASFEGGWTPLHVAAGFGTAEAVEALVRSEADLESRQENGATPLHVAASTGTAETIGALVRANADIEAVDNNGWTPLHIAAWNGTAETVDALVHAKANIEARGDDGMTPLHVAAGFGTAETVEALIRAKTNIESRADYGLTPLHVAAGMGTAEATETLIRANTNIEARDDGDWTPLHIAVSAGNVETIQALLRAGANINAKNAAGALPFDLTENHEILRLAAEANRESESSDRSGNQSLLSQGSKDQQHSNPQHANPAADANNVPAVSDIRWCVREHIRIEVMQESVVTVHETHEFKQVVSDYNDRCAHYDSSDVTWQQVLHDMESEWDKIALQAATEATQWMVERADSNSQSSSLQSPEDTQDSPASEVQASNPTCHDPTQYTEPPVGRGNLLTLSQIRWCIREDIRLDAIKNIVRTRAKIREFEKSDRDYRSRCGKYRVRRGDKEQAERDVEPCRSRIADEAIREAKQSGSSRNRSSSSQDFNDQQHSPAQEPQTPALTYIGNRQYIKPPVGTGNVLTVPQIRWCIREDIRLDAVKNIVNTRTKIREFEKSEKDYRSRCRKYRVRRGDKEQAERDIAPHRSQIAAEAKRRFRQSGRLP